MRKHQFDNGIELDKFIDDLIALRDRRREQSHMDQDIRIAIKIGGIRDGKWKILLPKEMALESFRDLRGSSPVIWIGTEELDG